MPEPGRLRHRLTLQAQATTATTSMGQPYENFTTAATVWGSIEPLSGSELWRAKQVESTASHRITIRGGHTITPAMRISHESRTFNIISVVNDRELNFYKTLICEEVV